MKPLPSLPPAHPITSPSFPRRWPLAAGVLAALLLGACTSTPLPPWPAQNARVVPPPRAKAPAVVQRPADQATASPVTTPVTGAADQAGSAALIENAAVAAHFPDPSVRYDTPGLRTDRRAWTTDAELSEWLDELASASGGKTQVRKIDAGRSQGGVPLLALALSGAAGEQTPQANGRPTVLLVGGQHGDEPAGTEALLAVARELSQGLLESLLQRVNVIVLPRANPDGASANRHATSDGTDLDQDHLALRTPEAQAIAQLIRTYRPTVIVDVHEYPVHAIDASGRRLLPAEDVLAQPATAANVPEFITKAAREWFMQPIFKSLDAEGLSHRWSYTLTTDNGQLAAHTGDAQPDSLRNLGGLDNAVSLSLASRGAGLGRAHIQRRVHSLVVALTSVLRGAAQRSSDLRQVQDYVARNIASSACQGTLTVRVSPTTTEQDLNLIDEASGELTPIKVPWTSTAALRPELQRPRPCGYWLSADSAAAQRLGLLGLQVLRIAEDGSVLTERFPGQGGDDVAAQALRTTMDVPAGSFYVGLNQSLANVAAAALEPGTPFNDQSTGVFGDAAASARVISNPSLVFDESE